MVCIHSALTVELLCVPGSVRGAAEREHWLPLYRGQATSKLASEQMASWNGGFMETSQELRQRIGRRDSTSGLSAKEGKAF